jgi:hypothetical protein
MRSRYVVVMGICLLPAVFGCGDDSSNSSTGSSGSGGTGSTTSTTSNGGSGGTGGSATTASGGASGSATTGGGTAGSGGSTGGSTGGSGGGSPDASVSDGNTSCNSACDCPAGNGCFNNKCSGDFFAFCCGSDACKNFSDALCQRSDKSYSTCGAASDGGKDADVDFCPFFGCASGQACPPGCTKCGMNDICAK